MQGIKTDGIRQVILDEENSVVRFVFTQDGNDFYFDVPSDNMQAVMPMLIDAVETSKSPATLTAIKAADAAVELDEAGDILLTLRSPSGATLAYHLPLPLSLELSALLDQALQARSGSTSQH